MQAYGSTAPRIAVLSRSRNSKLSMSRRHVTLYSAVACLYSLELMAVYEYVAVVEESSDSLP